jgi:Leucine-rich repeat (LRR) protein
MLDDITFHISHMTQLSYLELSNNRISSLGSKARDQLERIHVPQIPSIPVN